MMKRSYTFKPSFLDKMTGIQLQAWIEAAESVLKDHQINFEKDFRNGTIAFQLANENDYREVCNLSLDIGQKALSLEAHYLSEAFYRQEIKSVAGHA